MCLIIDANSLSEFFVKPDYLPAYKWIAHGAGKVIIGGTKYENELARCEAALDLIVELGRKGKTRKLEDSLVDEKQEEVEARSDLESDDPHIIAMVILSKCRVVCTNDRGLQKDFKKQFRKRFGVAKPRTYKGVAQKGVLTAKHIVAFCK
jgi:hypothetical protein